MLLTLLDFKNFVSKGAGIFPSGIGSQVFSFFSNWYNFTNTYFLLYFSCPSFSSFSITNSSVVFGAAEFSPGFSEDTGLFLTVSGVLGRQGAGGREGTFSSPKSSTI